MGTIGFMIALLVSVSIAIAGTWFIDRRPVIDLRLLYLFVLAMLGVYGGSELFGGVGRINSFSETGLSIDGFYIFTGIIGGLILVATAVLSQRKAAQHQPTDISEEGIQDPKLIHLLLNDSRTAALWLGVRVYVGYQWFEAGWHKVTDPAWMDTGTAVQGFWERAVFVPEEGRPVITYDWYRGFIQYLLDNGWYTWFARFIAVGEVLIGVALILGMFVGIAAFFGAVLNVNFMLAGTASTNPVLLLLSVFLILAWKVAGYWGLDRYLLPAIGTPWQREKVFSVKRGEEPIPARV